MTNNPEQGQEQNSGRGFNTIMSRRKAMEWIFGAGAGAGLVATGLGLTSEAEAQGLTGQPTPEPTATPGATLVAEANTKGQDSAAESNVSSVEGSNVDGFNSVEDAIAFMEQNYTLVSSEEHIPPTSLDAIKKSQYSEPKLFTFKSIRTAEELKCVISKGVDQKFYILSMFGRPLTNDKLTDTEVVKTASREYRVIGNQVIVNWQISNVTDVDKSERYGTVKVLGETEINGVIVVVPLIFVNSNLYDGVVRKILNDNSGVGHFNIAGIGPDYGKDGFSLEAIKAGTMSMVNGGEYFMDMNALNGLVAGRNYTDILNDPNILTDKYNGKPYLNVPVYLTQNSQESLSKVNGHSG